MNTKLKVTLKVFDNVASAYLVRKNYIEENLKEVCEKEDLTVGEMIYPWVAFLLCMFVFDFFG